MRNETGNEMKCNELRILSRRFGRRAYNDHISTSQAIINVDLIESWILNKRNMRNIFKEHCIFRFFTAAAAVVVVVVMVFLLY